MNYRRVLLLIDLEAGAGAEIDAIRHVARGVLAGFVAWARFTRARVVRRELRAA